MGAATKRKPACYCGSTAKFSVVARAQTKTSPKKALLGLSIVVVVLGAGFLVSRLLSGDKSGGNSLPSSPVLLERRGECAPLLAFASLLGDPNRLAKPEGVADLNIVADSAPTGIRSDVQALVVAVRTQPNNTEAVKAPAFLAARERLARYLAEPASGCQSGSESSDG